MADETMETTRECHCQECGVKTWCSREPLGWLCNACVVKIAQERKAHEPAQANEPRAIIRHFAQAMERKLAANDGVKGTWRDKGTFGIWWLGDEEYSELRYALYEFINLEDQDAPEDVLATARQAVLDEAADVANYLAMLCDVVGALPPTDERGR